MVIFKEIPVIYEYLPEVENIFYRISNLKRFTFCIHSEYVSVNKSHSGTFDGIHRRNPKRFSRTLYLHLRTRGNEIIHHYHCCRAYPSGRETRIATAPISKPESTWA